MSLWALSAARPLTDEEVARCRRAALHSLMSTRLAAGWALAAVEGDAELAGPDDRLDGLNPTDIPRLLRAAAGGTEADWAALDGAMATERHTAVLLRPRRVYPTATD
jgi:hypothetical protein